MPDVFKGGLFVGSAVVVGILAGLLIPQMVVADRDSKDRGERRPKPALPTMPAVIGDSVSDAEAALERRRIAHETDADGILGVVIPEIWEVCDSDPLPGAKVSGTVHLTAALPGTCAGTSS
jgi:hypothetical protein